ncbi:isoleucine--tRNA ligase [Malassezia brasiliensis]|uniref:Isoleucine--tRNA ligase, cytoplasmic n=1 Tax=Malassezia brasiliensis TaxID=1821822 RepID=A0AAF0DTR9_9BASI|nr:isoleucine--tRNA ligase [Malassezia brasiliensis]
MTDGAQAAFPEHDASTPFHFSKQEEAVMAYWNAIDAFKTQLANSKGKKPFSFYDGPPFATGLPHYGHLLAGTVKDIVTRFATSTGHYVDRRFGWDCHGLPVEHEIDKKLGVRGKDDILKMGIAQYNAECRAIVMRYQSEWRATVERMGRWIDFDHGYRTMDTNFMETEWWVFKTLFEKGQVYRGLRVMPYSTGLTTPLSNFEAGSNYKEVQDPAVTVAFVLRDDPTTAFLAWTTTPWTLPSNLALCVHPDLDYVKIWDEERQRHFILCDKLLGTVYKDPKKAKIKTVEKYKGKDLGGIKFVPLYNYFYEQFKDRAYCVLVDTYVTAETGTGVVHQAPAFGEDDYRVALEHGVIDKETQPPCPVDESGRYLSVVTDFAGQYVKDADKNVQKDLKARDLLIVQSTIRHQYPFCWRSGTPLIYRAIPAWFVRVESIQGELQANNQKTRWVPQTIGENRFGNWIAAARDWNVSRNRYWGTPIPLWVSDDFEEVECIGSIAELEERSGRTGITDLHRDHIDPITLPSRQGKGTLRRVEEVFDCWFESGSMPYAQAHYPFENRESFEASFPADFISEGLDQTRGWFYTLLILGTHLFGTAPWKNLIVSGLVLAADGKKMSKSLRNFPDPSLVIDRYGADAVRLYMINSPIVRAENLRFREEGVKDMIASVFLPWLNSFRFFLAQVVLLKKDTGVDFQFDPKAPLSENVMDRWVLARCQSLIAFVRQEMENYRLYTVVPRLLTMINELTNWYIRFNRKRLKGENGKEDTVAALNTLFETLMTVCRTMSSFTPFLTENLYQGLRKFLPPAADDGIDYRSVHFLPFPEVREDCMDPVIQRRFSALQSVIELGRAMREKKNLPLRVPLRELTVFHSDKQFLDDVQSLAGYVEEELNIRDLVLTQDEDRCAVRFKLLADWPTLGKKLRKDMGKVKKGLDQVNSAQAKEYMKTNQITIEGIPLGEGDLRAQRYVDEAVLASHILSDTDGQVVVLLDTEVHPELQAEGAARDVINRIQRLRKKAGLQPTDAIDYFYRFTEGMADALDDVMKTQSEVFTRNLRRVPRPAAELPEGADVVFEEEQEVNDAKFMLTLVRA